MGYEKNIRIEKALNRLRAMGLKVHVEGGENEAYIFVDMNSIADLVSRQIQLPNKKVYLVEGYMVIKVWREKT